MATKLPQAEPALAAGKRVSAGQEPDALLQISHATVRLADRAFGSANVQRLRRIVREQRQSSKRPNRGLNPRRRVLLVGASKTSRARTAASLAGELGVPLFAVRLDVLLTRHAGETAANLRNIIETLAYAPGVYFFDEYDWIGGRRPAGKDVAEARQVLNALLFKLEQDPRSLIVAATSCYDALNYALFRRFDDVIACDLQSGSSAVLLQ